MIQGECFGDDQYLVLFSLQVVGFVWGFMCEQFVQTVYILGAGVFVACLVSNTVLFRAR